MFLIHKLNNIEQFADILVLALEKQMSNKNYI